MVVPKMKGEKKENEKNSITWNDDSDCFVCVCVFYTTRSN